MEVEGLPWVALDWGRGVGWQRFEEERLAMGQVCSEEGLPKGVVAEAMERKGAKRKMAQRQPQVNLVTGESRRKSEVLAWTNRGAQGKSPVFDSEV